MSAEAIALLAHLIVAVSLSASQEASIHTTCLHKPGPNRVLLDVVEDRSQLLEIHAVGRW
ncbi:hypothetical protein BDK88_0623 [Natrinema hispanicum]|uniref:Uncharacterized protein n=1 Tax=Natrinema hispanicum TaxID=392421 RepID=A0A482YIJ4_9EURY|nr:hypothetical protein BDK88_0623 [Natrinema hispanicum]